MKKIIKNKYLILRRLCQVAILTLFANNSLNYILKGDLSSSLLFNKINLSDPYAVLQIVLAGLSINVEMLLSGVLVFIFYAIVGGRVFCAYVCPVNIITDFAAFMHERFNFKSLVSFKNNTRYYLVAFFLAFSYILNEPIFERISYIGIITRGIIFLNISAIFIVILIFVFDTFVHKRGVCGHLCPLGGFFALISRFSLLKVRYSKEKCTTCLKCKKVCPEPQVLELIAKHSGDVVGGECLRCARCIEVCEDEALDFNILKGIK